VGRSGPDFSGWHFYQSKKEDSRLLPERLKARLVQAAEQTEVADNVERASSSRDG
jgi:hypothetical protein